MMTDEPGPAPDDNAIEAAAEHAERAVQERREMARTATQADAADGRDSDELKRESEQHGRASHEQEDAAQEAAREADDT
jgi:hypothetical protein